jgi:CubicO group peptidase (beta-lactamase class C family)
MKGYGIAFKERQVTIPSALTNSGQRVKYSWKPEKYSFYSYYNFLYILRRENTCVDKCKTGWPMHKFLRLIFLISLVFGTVFGQVLKTASPQSQGFDEDRLNRLDQLVTEAIADSASPGGVLLISRNDVIVYRKAFGYQQLIPGKIEMSVHTVFDLASVTKAVATATSAMILIERGKLRLLDPVSRFIPAFHRPPVDSMDLDREIRVIHLLTHTSGLPAYAPADILTQKYGSPAPDSLIKYIATDKRHHAPGEYFKYSCLNFITLQRIVESVSGKSLNDFSRENIFGPLGMKFTTYQPPADWNRLIAPTELLKDSGLLLGVVHDPLARMLMGGVSGNAGLFSTIDDLAVFASMMLNKGRYNGRIVLSPAAVQTMTTIPTGYEKFGRALGWDIHSDYSSNKGDLLSVNTYGHTGYTGTSIVIDPDTRIAIIMLTNRAHPYDKGNVVRLRSLIANVVAGSIIK